MTYENKAFLQLQYQAETVEGHQFYDCTFTGCDFSELQVVSCSFRNCLFQSSTILNNTFRFTDAANNQFIHCVMIGISWSDLMKSKTIFLPFADFRDCTLRYNVFYQLKLNGFSFAHTDLGGSFFEKCELKKSNFSFCMLKDVQFAENDLRDADFRHAEQYLFSVQNNRLRGSRFSFPDALSLLAADGIHIDYES